MATKKEITYFIVIGLFVASLVGMVFYMSTVLFVDTQTYETILLADTHSVPVASISEKGNQFYLEASLSYEDGDYKSTESNCRLARNYFSDANEGYLNVKSEMTSSRSSLVVKYSELLDVLAEMQWNLYEACEHFESASRYYDTYYNTGVSFDDTSFDLGNAEIELMNEKIVLHDDNVRKYNSVLSEYRVELEKKIK